MFYVCAFACVCVHVSFFLSFALYCIISALMYHIAMRAFRNKTTAHTREREKMSERENGRERTGERERERERTRLSEREREKKREREGRERERNR